MSKGKSYTGFVYCLAGLLLIPAILLPAKSVWAQSNILIVRPATQSAAYKKPKIVFQVRISAFSKILSVKIDGKPVKAAKSTLVLVKHPYLLKPGENKIVVEAQTGDDKVTQTFTLFMGDFKDKAKLDALAARKKKTRKEARKPFRFIGLLGMEKAQNALKAPDTVPKTDGTRSFLILIPSYDLKLDDKSSLQFKAVVAREHYQEDELKGNEALFTELSMMWRLGGPRESAWLLGAGFDRVDKGNKSFFQGESHGEDDTFLIGGYQAIPGPNQFADFLLEYRSQSVEEAPLSDPDYASSAKNLTLKAFYSRDFDAFRGKARAIITDHDALGKYKDKQVTQVQLDVSYPLTPFLPTFSLLSSQEGYKELDPLQGVTPKTQTLKGLLGLNYQLFSSGILLLEYVWENRRSNVPTLEYQYSATSLAMAYVF